MATFEPPSAEKLFFSDKTLACLIDCTPKPRSCCISTSFKPSGSQLGNHMGCRPKLTCIGQKWPSEWWWSELPPLAAKSCHQRTASASASNWQLYIGMAALWVVVVRVATKEELGSASASATARLPTLYGAAAQFSVLTILSEKELLGLKYFRWIPL